MQTLLRYFTVSLALAGFATASVLGHSANEPVSRGDQWWQDRHKLINQRAADAGDKAQVIFIGDSITHGWEGAGKDVWEKHYAPRNAINLGISGDRTQHVLWRLDNGNIDGIKPKAAVVMIGTNNSNGEDNTPGQIIDGVTAIVNKLRAKLPETKVMLVAIFPRNENISAQRGKILQVNQALRRLADQRDVYWVDFGHLFMSDDGVIAANLMPDFLHLSTRGYEIWADSIERRLASIVGDSPVRPQSADVSGDWLSVVRSDGQTFEIPFTLQSEGARLTGKFSRGDDRWLDIENGRIRGSHLSWIVKRDRPDGSIMTYRMTGTVEDGKITGVARTQLNGQEQSVEWTATRK